jgi:hypothetical protein
VGTSGVKSVSLGFDQDENKVTGRQKFLTWLFGDTTRVVKQCSYYILRMNVGQIIAAPTNRSNGNSNNHSSALGSAWGAGFCCNKKSGFISLEILCLPPLKDFLTLDVLSTCMEYPLKAETIISC